MTRPIFHLWYAYKSGLDIEGGPLHVAVDSAVPTFLISSTEWLGEVKDVLPPRDRNALCTVNLRIPDVDHITQSLVNWLGRQDTQAP